MATRTVAALSGGVDSAVAAVLAKDRGDDVIGMTLRLYDSPRPAAHSGGAQTAETVSPRHGSCCAPEDIDDARRVASQLEIPFYVLEASGRFQAHVIEPFLTAYRTGKTPLPCAACNRHLKFGHLLDRARALSARLCTGHYARIERRADGGFRLLKARDARRDQSYFLYGLQQQDLAELDFPLGTWLKEEVRGTAQQRGLRIALKPDSQELCFVSGSYADYVESHGGGGVAGPMLDQQGTELGRHTGVHRFTIGQRHGLPIVSATEPRYVTRISGDSGAVEVGPANALLCDSIEVGQTSYPGGLRSAPFEALVRIRHQHAGEIATVTPLEGQRAALRFRQPVRAAAPGQAAVFYDGDETVGGGVIA